MKVAVGVGQCKDIDSYTAGLTCAKKALDSAGITTCDFAFLFSTVGYDMANLMKGVLSVIGNVKMCGCSGTGTITQLGPEEDLHSVAIMVIKSEDLYFHNTVGKNLKENSYDAGNQVAKNLKKYIDKNSILMTFPDSLSANTKKFFEGLNNGFEQFIPVIGGLSADNMKMTPELNYQFCNGEILHDSSPSVLISGNFSYEIGVSHGCVPLGLERTVTLSKGNRIYTIDGIPSFDIIKEYTDDNLTDLNFELIVHLCYGVKISKKEQSYLDDYIVRTPLTLDKKDGSVTIPTEIATGSKINLMRRDPDKIIKRLDDIKAIISSKWQTESPFAVIHINCAGRGRALMGRNVLDEFNSSLNIFNKRVPWLGYYSYGEIAPIGRENQFHNYTSIIFALYK